MKTRGLPRMTPLALALILLFSLVMGTWVAWAILQSDVTAIRDRLDHLPRPTPTPITNCSGKCSDGKPGEPGTPGPAGRNGSCTVPCANGTAGRDGADGLVQITIIGEDNATSLVQYNTSFASVTITLSDNETFVSLPGPPGTNGTDGTDGVDGLDGLDGLNGTCLVPCVNGTNGLDGQDGQDGLDGANGTCTSPCVNGTNGRDGFNGSCTVPCVNGQNGTNGRDGTNGTCTPCLNGVNGTNGVNGVNGTNGRDGTNGTNGSNGVNGTNGRDGTNGTNGGTGTPGVNGTNGVDGINGVDAHVSVTITGQDNDTSVVVYNTSFANLTIIISDNDTFVSLPGPPGPAGPAGSNGTNGADGRNGTDGTNGRNGTDGVNGVNGINGTNGANGINGINGTNGINGVNGTNGVNGLNGTNGINGINGTNGASGANGINGTNGINGVNGTNGINGVNGSNGINGQNGTNGINGVNGTCAESCPNGTTTITFNTVVYVSQNGTDAPSFGTILQPFATIAYAMSQVEPTHTESWTIYLLGEGNIVENQTLYWKPNVNLAALSEDRIGVTFFELITLDFDAWNGTETSTNSISMSNIVFFSNTTILFDFNTLGYGGYPTIKFSHCQFGLPGGGQQVRILAGNALVPTLYTSNIVGNTMYLNDTAIHSVGDTLDYLQMTATYYDSEASMLASSVSNMAIFSSSDIDWKYSLSVRGSRIGGVQVDGSHSRLFVDSASLSDPPPLRTNYGVIHIVDRLFQQIHITTSLTPGNLDPTAIFKADSTTQLMYIPVMTTDQKEAITPSREGAMVFDTTLGRGSLWNGTAWNSFG